MLEVNVSVKLNREQQGEKEWKVGTENEIERSKRWKTDVFLSAIRYFLIFSCLQIWNSTENAFFCTQQQAIPFW